MSRTKKHKLTGGKAVDPSCRNHGDCPVCQGNRLHKNQIRQQSAEQKENDEQV
jgi:hypothetical protein